MILNVQKIKEGVTERVYAGYDAKTLDLEFVDLHYLTKIDLKGFAEKIANTLTFRGILSFRLEQLCARCLEKIENEISTPFDLSYSIDGQEKIDTTPDLRDILILNHPDRFLCKKDCKGICSRCGANLNKEKCRCA